MENCITSLRMPRLFKDKVERIANEKLQSFSTYTRTALLEKLNRDTENQISKWSITK